MRAASDLFRWCGRNGLALPAVHTWPASPASGMLSVDRKRVLGALCPPATLPSSAGAINPHRSVPELPAILKVGPNAPAAPAWLWKQWGTCRPLRRMERLARPLPIHPVATQCLALQLLFGLWPARLPFGGERLR